MSGRLASVAFDGQPETDESHVALASVPLSAVESRPANRLKQRLIVADSAAFALGIAVAFGVQFVVRPLPASSVLGHVLLLLIAMPCFALGAGFNHLYRARANDRWTDEAWNVVKSVAVSVTAVLAVAFVVQYKDLSRLWVGLLGVCITSALVIERSVARRMFARMRRERVLSRRIVIVGTDAHAVGLLHTYQRNPGLGYEVVGFAGNDDLGRRGGVETLGPIADLPRLLRDVHAVGVVVSLSSVTSEEVNLVTRQLTEDGFHVALSSSLRDIDVTRLRPQELDGRTMIYVEPVLRGGWRAAAKRAFDVTLATGLLIVTAPLLLVSMIALRLDTKGSVFFRQVRVGKNGELFELIKLRTMVCDAEAQKAALQDRNEADGALFKIKNDPRITRVGRVLRKLSIDELPQLWCVLRGTMSMVGPRPALPDEVERWEDDTVERLRVLPGLTGLWQVSGRSDSSFETYKRLDLFYVDNWSLRHDALICLKTVGVVLSGSGAA